MQGNHAYKQSVLIIAVIVAMIVGLAAGIPIGDSIGKTSALSEQTSEQIAQKNKEYQDLSSMPTIKQLIITITIFTLSLHQTTIMATLATISKATKTPPSSSLNTLTSNAQVAHL